MNHIFWVGIKESEIRTCKHLFEGSVTFIGSGKNGNISFSSDKNYIINYNENSVELDDFMRKSLHMIIERIPEVHFFCYTASYIYSLEDTEINEHIICENSRATLQLLRNKMNTRFWLKRYVPILPTMILAGCECQFSNLLSLFPKEDSFTIQGCSGAGGADTYIMKNSNYQAVEKVLFKDNIYLISPYKKHSYSVNVHILFTDKKYYLSPGSIQIVEYQHNRMIFRGSDFTEYNNISQKIQDKIIFYTRTIAEKLQMLPYKGILGIDYLIVDSEVYFLEINPRFQSSTPLLNLALHEKELPSIQEMILNNEKDKDDWLKNIFSDLSVKYSSYIIDYEDNKYDYISYLKLLKASPEIEELVLDGYTTNTKCQAGASIYSITFRKNIISLNPEGTYYIYDNVKPPALKNINLFSENDCKWLKFAMMNQGISFSETAIKQISYFQKGVYSSLDIYISDTFIINTPTEMPYHSLSPFKLDYINNKMTLYYGENFVSYIDISLKKDYCKRFTKHSINFQHISFIATDRLRIHHSPNCLFQTNGAGCKFCDVSGNSIYFDMQDIREVIDWHLKNSHFRHILIGGASGDYPQEYLKILEIVKYIKDKSDKPIYIMTLPPKNISILEQYYDAGVDEVAFNIEIYDRKLAQNIMPGKGSISLKIYQNALLHSVKLWGNGGKVRSLLVYGLEKDSTFFEGIEWLASHGIQPVISPFRALGGTMYENTVPPTTTKLLNIYEKASAICQQYNLQLGPECVYCQNNTLSFDSRIVFHSDN